MVELYLSQGKVLKDPSANRCEDSESHAEAW